MKPSRVILGLETFEGDRNLRPGKVLHYIKCMKQDTFLTDIVDLIVCTCGGIQYRMNGQHVCNARLDLDRPAYRGNGKVRILYWNAETVQDMRRLYSSIDRGTPRTRADVLNSYLFGEGMFEGYSQTVIKQIGEGLHFWVNSNMTPDDVAYVLQTMHYQLALKVGKCLALCGSLKHLKRSPVFGAMFATFFKHGKEAAEFWENVSTGANLGVDSPMLKLQHKLMQSNVRRKGLDGKVSMPEDMYGWCIQAWNAFRKGTKVRFTHSDNGRIKVL